MRNNPLDAYRVNRIQTASPVTVSRILLEETVRATRTAREQMNTDDEFERSRRISKAMNILTEFMLTLNDKGAPELALRLKQICEYAHHQLMSAHIRRSEAHLTEVIDLLQTILDAWIVVENREARARVAVEAAGQDSSLTVAAQ